MLSALLSKKEAAERLRLSLSALSERMANGEIAYRKLGRRVVFAEQDLAEYLERVKVERRPA